MCILVKLYFDLLLGEYYDLIQGRIINKTREQLQDESPVIEGGVGICPQ